MAYSLSQSTLHHLPATVAVPAYERAALSPGIVHIGVGNFHRAHQAVYLDRLFNKGLAHDWAIIGAGIKPYDAKMRQTLANQDWMSTVIELDPDGYKARVCGAMIGYADVSVTGLIKALLKPEIRIVSMTITEGGYYLDPQTGGFDAGHPEMMRDGQNPDDPQTVFGALVCALKTRKSLGIVPFTVMSCDNLPENGKVARQTVVGLAKLMAPETADWINQTVAFPNSMVDCITPATSDRERDMASRRFEIDDPTVVICEPFRQWVIEDKFSCGRPALEEVGVEFINDVSAYELMKLRILNGGHSAIAYPAALLGHTYVHDAMRDPVIGAFLEKLEFEEIIPTVPQVPGVNFGDYFRKTKERFANPEIGDTIARLCLDGSNRQPKFILPTITDRLTAGSPIDGLALEVAMWCRFCAGTDDSGKPLQVHDENAKRLQENALKAKETPTSFIAMNDIFGSLSTDEKFIATFSKALAALWTKGTVATLKTYVNG